MIKDTQSLVQTLFLGQVRRFQPFLFPSHLSRQQYHRCGSGITEDQPQAPVEPSDLDQNTDFDVLHGCLSQITTQGASPTGLTPYRNRAPLVCQDKHYPVVVLLDQILRIFLAIGSSEQRNSCLICALLFSESIVFDCCSRVVYIFIYIVHTSLAARLSGLVAIAPLSSA